MHSKVFSDWLPSYIKATRLVLEIFKMAGYFPDSLRKYFFRADLNYLGLSHNFFILCGGLLNTVHDFRLPPQSS